MSIHCRKAYLGVGSNLGDRQTNIMRSIVLLSSVSGIAVTRVSPLYETKPVGMPSKEMFLNGAIEIITEFDPRRLLDIIEGIEKQLGRTAKGEKKPRTIDLDILLFDDIILNENDLVIPHPEMNKRDFVMKPLNDIR